MVLNFIQEVMLSRMRFVIVTANLATDTMKKFTSTGWQCFTGRLSFFTLGLMASVIMFANIGRAQTNFASAQVLTGNWGTVTNDNTGVTPDIGTPSIAGFAAHAPLWYQWTAPEDGEVTLDTVGSIDDGSSGP